MWFCDTQTYNGKLIAKKLRNIWVRIMEKEEMEDIQNQVDF